MEFDVGVFEFDEDEGKAVDVEQDVGAAVVMFAFDPELGDGEVLVVVEVVVVDDANGGLLGASVGVFVFDVDAVA